MNVRRDIFEYCRISKDEDEINLYKQRCKFKPKLFYNSLCYIPDKGEPTDIDRPGFKNLIESVVEREATDVFVVFRDALYVSDGTNIKALNEFLKSLLVNIDLTSGEFVKCYDGFNLMETLFKRFGAKLTISSR